MSRHTLLTADEEAGLLRRATQGDRDAVETLVINNQGLVIQIAERYYNAGSYQDLEDLIQWGSIGLLRAITKWDGRAGRFTTYATYWIRAVIRRNASHATVFSMSDRDSWYTTRISRARSWLLETLEREPTTDEIAEKTGLPFAFVDHQLQILTARVSLERPGPGKDEDGVVEIPDLAVCTESEAEQDMLLQKLYQAIRELSPIQQEVIFRHRLSDPPETLNQIGHALDMTGSRVQQIEYAAMDLLKRKIGSMGLLC
jgi:RNA polymerase sigma factor (sigma-70 family)